MPITKTQIGKIAEQDACRYLKQQGLTLRDQNYRSPWGEIDLIMQDQNQIVFVEVRKRSRIDYGHALESITTTKIKRIIQTAKYYLQHKRLLHNMTSRFDIITLQSNNDKIELNWIKNAFFVG